MLSVKATVVAALLVVTPLPSTAIRVDDSETRISNPETLALAPCIGWRPDVLDAIVTGLQSDVGQVTPKPPREFPWEVLRLVRVPASGSCEVIPATGMLAYTPILAVVKSEVSDRLGSNPDVSGLYVLMEFRAPEGERRFGALALPPPTLEQELRGIGQLHALNE